jgi:hypothetical protein
VQDITEISGMEFCKTCNLRVGWALAIN